MFALNENKIYGAKMKQKLDEKARGLTPVRNGKVAGAIPAESIRRDALKFDKLVRDKIPEIIKKDGKKPITHIATREEYVKRLDTKLKEEALEFYGNGRTEELADVLEVVCALYKTQGVEISDLEQIRKEKAEERGSMR